MGNNMCKPSYSKKDGPTFYYKNIIESPEMPGFDSAKNPKEKCKLSMILRNCSNKDYTVRLLIYDSPTSTNYVEKGTTEDKSPNDGVVIFSNFFVMEYYFERQQKIGFETGKRGDYSTRVETTLAAIMSSRGQRKKFKVTSGEELEVIGEPLKESNGVCSISVTASGQLHHVHLRYALKYIGTQNKPSSSLLYESEERKGTSRDNNKINFSILQIPMMYLNSTGDPANNYIQFEIIDTKSERPLGEHSLTLKQLLDEKINFTVQKGISIEIVTEKFRQVSFLDYLRGGLQIGLTIGIDFTGSNGSPSSPSSLHYVGGTVNSYEAAIRACGDIVAYYDYDQMFPVFGYGASLQGQNVSHCFPISGNSDNPNVYTINGVIQAYKEILGKIDLAGPTYFAPLINEFISIVKKSLTPENPMQYFILMILTDGQNHDMEDTKDAVVNASLLPISIIIIGIGNGNFGNMVELDGDETRVRSRDNRYAERDIVQFVPFNKFSNNAERLAQEVLEEIPRQVIEYFFKMKKIPPPAPIMDIK